MAFMFPQPQQAMTPEGISRQRQIAQALMQQGMDYSPVQSPWQGAARIAQALLGGYKNQQAEQAAMTLQKQEEAKAAAAKAEAERRAAAEAQQPVYKYEGGQWWNVNPRLPSPLAVSEATQRKDDLTAYQKAQLARQQKLDDWRMKITDSKAQAAPKFTEGQTKDAGWADRMATAEANISAATDPKNPKHTNPARWLNKVWSDDDNLMNSEGWQNYKQAKTEWILALLRKDTGAQISKQEFEDADKTYFPQPGEAESVVQAKAQSRRRVQESLAAGSAGAYEYFNQRRSSGAPAMNGPALDNRYQSMSDEDILRELGQ